MRGITVYDWEKLFLKNSNPLIEIVTYVISIQIGNMKSLELFILDGMIDWFPEWVHTLPRAVKQNTRYSNRKNRLMFERRYRLYIFIYSYLSTKCENH